ncbi:YqaJ viral recombinase family protein [Enterovibrio sp. 27052020O]|uniref:YqaJ viral recombinase family protein n=1 Tax=Enterovibrio sp. 27052020O TaxID=3241166 RepID=UPI00388E6A73
MKIINVTQGSQEWHDVRAQHFTASEAPAMMGESKYQTRGELLRQKATGESKEVNLAQQRIFDKGHAAEDAARPLVEALIGDELFPTTGTLTVDGIPLLASFDGITMMDDVIFEHKLLNQSLVARVIAGDLEPHYYWQLEQQLLVSGAEHAVFVCSDGTEDNFHHCEYRSQPERRAALLTGWHQFMVDLSGYHAEPVKEKVEAEPVRDLPAISYRMEGLSLHSNIDVFKEAALALVEQSKKTIETDQDFANAEAQVKVFKSAETKIKALSEQVLGEVQDIDTFSKDLAFIGEQIRQARLATDKQVKARKEEIRKQILDAATTELREYLNTLSTEIGAVMPAPAVSIIDAMKGKKTVTSLQEAADTAVAQSKIEAEGIAKTVRLNKETRNTLATNHLFLFNDWAQIAFKANDDFTALVKSRIADHQAAEEARLEAERARIRAEEEAKAKAKVEAEAKEAERERLIAEQQANAKAEADSQPQPKVSAYEEQQVQQAPVTSNAATKTTSAPQMQRASQVAPSVSQQLDNSMISISMREYRQLQARDAKLAALEAGGVDNWSGYDDAMSQLTDQAA